MDSWRKFTMKYKSIEWLLIVAILLITLAPAQYHVHHSAGEDPTQHEHVLDLHFVTEKVDQLQHDNDTVFVTEHNLILKKNDSLLTPFLFISLFLVLLPLIHKRIITKQEQENTLLPEIYFHLAPPLRAPPLS